MAYGGRLILGPVTLVVAALGCAAEVDQAAIINRVSERNPRLAAIREAFPDSQVSVRPVNVPFAASGHYEVSFTAALEGGFELRVSQQVKVAGPDEVQHGFEPHLLLRGPAGEALRLAGEEFDALVDAQGNLDVLEQFDIDANRRRIDEALVIEAVRQNDPTVERLYQTQGASVWAGVSREPFRRRGRFTARAALGARYALVVARPIRVGADGSITLAGPAEYSLERDNSPRGRLSEEQFEALLAAGGDEARIERIVSGE